MVHLRLRVDLIRLHRIDILADVDVILLSSCCSYLSQEPVQDEKEIVKFCEQTGLPVALDETIGNIRDNTLERLAKFTHPGVAAVVSGSILSLSNVMGRSSSM